MGKMREHWRNIKKHAEDVATGKIKVEWGQSDEKATKATLGKFGSGLGPTLDKLEKAYKDKKAADMVTHAEAAHKIVASYNKTVETAHAKGFGGAAYADLHVWLGVLDKQLIEVKAKGLKADPKIFT